MKWTLRLVLITVVSSLWIHGIVDSFCPDDEGTAIYEVSYECLEELLRGFERVGGKPFPQNFYEVQGWISYCKGTVNLQSCFEGKFSGCEQGYVARMVAAARQELETRWSLGGFFPTGAVCDGSAPRHNVTQLYSELSETCQEMVTDNVDVCVENWLEELDIGQQLDPDTKKRWARATYGCGVGRSPKQCGEAGRKLAKFLLDQTFTSDIRDSLTEQDIDLPISDSELLSVRRTTTGVFGDPHLEIYEHHRLQTCVAEGEHTYLANEFFKLQANSSFVAEGRSKATSLTALRLTFEEDGLVYLAENGALPSTFTNGATSDMAGGHVVNILEKQADRQVTLTVPRLGLVMQFRRWQQFYFFTLRASDDLYEKSYGLLVSGCSSKDILDISENQPQALRRRRSMTDNLQVECSQACASVENIDQFKYQEACLFDCATTHDVEIANMTYGFQESVGEVEAHDEELDLRPEPSPTPDTSGAATTASCLLSALLTLPLVALLSY